MNDFGIRPVHFTYVISDRRAHSFFFREVLEMKVLRHIEITRPSNVECPKRFENRWCKTVLGYGPEDSCFGIVVVYFYREGETGFNNEWMGATIRSLPAIARAKAIGMHMVPVGDRSFDVMSPSGRSYHIIDEHHRCCDPLFEIYLRVTDLNESLDFWSRIMCVPVINKTSTEFTLFFGNNNTRLRYIKTDEAQRDNHGHMSYTAPLEMLQVIEDRCPAQFLIQPLCKISYQARDSDHLLIIQDPSRYLHYFYDSESFGEICQFDPKAQTRWDLSMHFENKFQPPTSNLEEMLEELKRP